MNNSDKPETTKMRKKAMTIETRALPIQLKQNIVEYIEQTQPEFYWDYRDHLSEAQMLKIIESEEGYFEVCYDILEQNHNHTYELERHCVKEALKHYQYELKDFCGNDYDDQQDIVEIALDEFWDELKEHVCVKVNIEDLVRNSSACFNVVLTELEHNFSGWGFNAYNVQYEDIKDELKFFKINPRHVAEYFGRSKSEFPNYHWREGKELVGVDEYLREWLNHTSECAQIVFTVEINLTDFIANRAKYQNGITLNSGTRYWIHDPWNGACSLGEAELLTDIKLKKEQYKIEIDGQNGHGLDDICGLVKSAIWNVKITPFFETH